MDLKLNKKVIFSIFLGIIMLTSLFAFLYTGQDPNQPPTTPPVTPQTTTINYDAQNVQAKVVRLFPQVFFTATTRETNKAVLDEQVKKLSGVRSILQSYYSDPNSSGGIGQSDLSTLYYVAQLSITDNADVFAMQEQANDSNMFLAAEALRGGLVSLPEQVTFTNQDLNVTLDHDFQSPLSNAFLRPNTLVEDQIIVYLQGGFSASTLKTIQAVEQQNITAQPQEITLTQTHQITNLSQDLFFSFNATPLFLENEEQLKQTIVTGIQGAANPQASAGFFFPSLTITFDKNYSVFQQDMTTLLTDINGVQGQIFNLDQNQLTVFLDSTTFLETKSTLLSELEALNFHVVQTIDPVVTVNGSVSFDSNNLNEHSMQLKELIKQQEYFSTQNMQDISVLQNAFFEAQNFTAQDTNTIYDYPQKTFEAKIMPNHNLSDQVPLEITLSIVRGKIDSVTANEKFLEN